MKYIDPESIKSTFSILNESGIDYILIRNINNEIPEKLVEGKDIDILAKYSDKNKLNELLVQSGFSRIKHPNGKDLRLYNVNKFEFHMDKNGVILDVNYQLVCRSLDAGQWIPLDEYIQGSAWQNKKFVEAKELNYWRLGHEDEFITLIVRCIFDKKMFIPGYISRIEEIYDYIDPSDVKRKLGLVFFKYAPLLFEQIKLRRYSNIIRNYIQFKDY